MKTTAEEPGQVTVEIVDQLGRGWAATAVDSNQVGALRAALSALEEAIRNDLQAVEQGRRTRRHYANEPSRWQCSRAHDLVTSAISHADRSPHGALAFLLAGACR